MNTKYYSSLNEKELDKNKKSIFLNSLGVILNKLDENSTLIFKKKSEELQKNYDRETSDILHFLEKKGDVYSNVLKNYLNSLRYNSSLDFLFDIYEILNKLSESQRNRRDNKTIQRLISSVSSENPNSFVENSFEYREYIPKVLDMEKFLEEKRKNRF